MLLNITENVVKPIEASMVRALRQQILRPNQPAGASVYEGDVHPASKHFGAYIHHTLIGVASIYRQDPPDEDDNQSWRIRGMATRQDVRGFGFGSALLEVCVNYAIARRGRRIWCNGRETALNFYAKFGFEAKGEPFEIPGLGPHYILERRL